MARASAAKLTCDDLLSLPDDGRRHELIDGTHYVTPSPATRHQRVSLDLAVALHGYVERTGTGEAFTAPFDVVLSRHDVVVPDIVVVRSEQAGILTPAHARGAPAIVIEILSPGTRRRDLGVKRKLYERAGVGEYWMADIEARAITTERRGRDGRFENTVTFRADRADVLTSPLLPGFSLLLATIFRDRH